MRHRNITRRVFLALFAASFAAVALFVGKSFDTVAAIRTFFGFNDGMNPFIQKELDLLRDKHQDRLLATYLFFFLVHIGARAIIPQSIQHKMLKFWSWRMLRLRSISWPYVGYPQVEDQRICDGLIR